MDCSEAAAAVGAWIDGELEPAAAAGIAAHVEACRACASRARAYAQVGAAVRSPSLRHEPPADLVRAIAAVRRRRIVVPAWALPAAAGLLVGLALAGYRARSVRADALAAEIAGSHLRALQPGKLTDVVSSDRHTVKPWFAGRIDFAPPVPDLASAGFPLLGGRVDAVAGRPAAALVYGRRRHVIDVYVVPSAGAPGAAAPEWHGFHLASWTSEDLAFWAVSDVDRAELERFTALFRTGKGRPPG